MSRLLKDEQWLGRRMDLHSKLTLDCLIRDADEAYLLSKSLEAYVGSCSQGEYEALGYLADQAGMALIQASKAISELVDAARQRQEDDHE